MLFTSFSFLAFLIFTILGYFLLSKYQWQFLLIMSFIFYVFSGWQNLFFISATILSTYFSALQMDRVLRLQKEKLSGANGELLSKEDKKNIKLAANKERRVWLIICLIFNIGILAIMKYTGFLFSKPNPFGIIIPMGISFYTFQTMGYIIDIYYGKIAREENLFKQALFTSFFPQLVQGPISRFKDLNESLFARHSFSLENFQIGSIRVLFGFVKKLIIADRLMIALRVLLEESDKFQGIYVLIVMFFYAIILYADFTGGMDITIGIAKILGIKLAENFNRPFYSVSIADYWRRWHITMGTWFKDYLFYPISISKWMLNFLKFARKNFGDNTGKKLPVYFATLIVWIATGVWHGAEPHFLVWGLINGIFIIVSEQISPMYIKFHNKFHWSETAYYKVFMIFRTFWLMCFIRTFDVYANVRHTFYMYSSLFTNFSLRQMFTEGFSELGLKTVDYIVVGIGIITMILVGYFTYNKKISFVKLHVSIKWVVAISAVFAILIFGIYGFGYDSSQFIYNKF